VQRIGLFAQRPVVVDLNFRLLIGRVHRTAAFQQKFNLVQAPYKSGKVVLDYEQIPPLLESEEHDGGIQDDA